MGFSVPRLLCAGAVGFPRDVRLEAVGSSPFSPSLARDRHVTYTSRPSPTSRVPFNGFQRLYKVVQPNHEPALLSGRFLAPKGPLTPVSRPSPHPQRRHSSALRAAAPLRLSRCPARPPAPTRRGASGRLLAVAQPRLETPQRARFAPFLDFPLSLQPFSCVFTSFCASPNAFVCLHFCGPSALIFISKLMFGLFLILICGIFHISYDSCGLQARFEVLRRVFVS